MPRDESAIGQEFDVVVIGSGFGGAAVALRLAQAGRSVGILERGKEYPAGRGEITATGHGTPTIRHGHFQIDVGFGMNVIRGIGVGGGSLHYFGVRLRAQPEIFDMQGWPASINRNVLDPYYDVAGDILKAEPLQPNPVLGVPARSETFLAAAKKCRRCQREPHYVPIAVLTSQEPVETPSGIPQTPCVFCGECLIGCPPSASFKGNVNARALLTLNYLALAQQHKAQIFPEHRVDRVRKVADAFEIDVTLRGEGPPNRHGSLRSKQVVLSAGTLGSTEILLKSQDTLPPMSKKLGHHFSGNGDFLVPKTKDTVQDLQPKSGPSITVGADFSTADYKIFIEDLGKIPFLEAVFGMKKDTDPDFKRYELGYLGMGTDAGNGVLAMRDGRITLYWDPTDSLPLYKEIIASLREMTQQLGGNYANPEGYNAVTGTGLITAHPLGGCVMSDTERHGVVNPRGEVHGVPGLFVADGSMIPTALATNPSYTISALAERVAFWMIHGREMTGGDSDAPPNK